MPDNPLWGLPALTDPIISDMLLAVDAPGGSAATRSLLISNLAKLTLSNVVVQVKTVGSGTYTPTAGMKKVLCIGVGAGGGGDAGLGTDSAGGGGGGGGTVIVLRTAAEIGASKAYVVGAHGLGRTSAQVSTAGTATTIDTAGALLNAGGGGPGGVGAQGGVIGAMAGGTGGTAANGDLLIPGTAGFSGVVYDGTSGCGGGGGRSVFGFGGKEPGTNIAGIVGQAYGGGGSGGHASSATDKNGANGADGILYLVQFI